jgi:hypothetical protein
MGTTIPFVLSTMLVLVALAMILAFQSGISHLDFRDLVKL